VVFAPTKVRVPGEGDGWTPHKICYKIPIRQSSCNLLSHNWLCR
jgi:hypothetical protein